MRVLVCGDRNWSDYGAVLTYVRTLPSGSVVIEGEARGADTMSHDAAIQCGLEVMPFPAKWGRYGRAAGPIRNQQMLDEGLPTLVVYFHNDLASSKGTADMVRRARKAGLPVVDGSTGLPYEPMEAEA